MRPRRALIPLVTATLLLTSCALNSGESIGLDPSAEQAQESRGAEAEFPSPAETQAPENTLTDEQLREISLACFDESVADPEMLNVIAAMPEEWAQSTYEMAIGDSCYVVEVNVEEWRKMGRFDE